MKKRFLIWPLAFTVPAVAILLVMGFWQLDRLAWKEGLIEKRAVALAADPLRLPQDINQSKDLDFYRVFLTGRFLHDLEILVQNRNHDGVRGLHVLTPLQRVSEEGGGTILVNRGWVPLQKQDPGARNNQPQDTVRIAGIVRIGVVSRNAFTPANDPVKNLWYDYDPENMARFLGFESQPLIVEIDQASSPGTFPVTGLSHYELKNNHLYYALTWFSLAAGLVLIFGLFLRQRLR